MQSIIAVGHKSKLKTFYIMNLVINLKQSNISVVKLTLFSFIFLNLSLYFSFQSFIASVIGNAFTLWKTYHELINFINYRNAFNH